MVQLLTGPAPTIAPRLAGSGPTSALANEIINQNNASNLQALAGGYKRMSSRKLIRSRRSRRSRMSSRKLRRSRRSRKLGSKRFKTKGRKVTRRRRLYKGGAGDPIPYSAPSGSNAAVLNISEELALAHAAANVNARLDGSASNAPTK